MHTDLSTIPLETLGVLGVRGADALSFLQGQLSSDVALLAPERAQLAGYHNPQGRVIAVLRLLQLAPDELIAVLPRELVAAVRARLGKFILRAKVKLSDESAHWRVSGLLSAAEVGAAGLQVQPPASALGAALPAQANATAHVDGTSAIRLAYEPACWLLLSPAAQPALPGSGAAVLPALWRRRAIAAGEPQVYAATSGEFIAQMLNLDALGAIAFDKGCYAGQEVIARAHYRGRVKRRMQRFVTRAAQRLEPADAGTLADGRTFKVVDAVELADGRCEFLAVTQLVAESAPETPPPAAHAASMLDARQLELPYAQFFAQRTD